MARHWGEGWEQMSDVWNSAMKKLANAKPGHMTYVTAAESAIMGCFGSPARKPSLEDRIAALEKRVEELEKAQG